jgi:hypothetical protein
VEIEEDSEEEEVEIEEDSEEEEVEIEEDSEEEEVEIEEAEEEEEDSEEVPKLWLFLTNSKEFTQLKVPAIL